MHGTLKLSFVTGLVTLLIPLASSHPLAQSTPAEKQAEKQSDNSAKPLPSRPNPDASGIYHVGDGVTAPILVYSVEPQFSAKARKLKIAGCSAVFEFIVETNGHVHDVHLFRSCAEDFKDKKDREAAQTLDPEAQKAVSQYRFEPAKFQGHPVPVKLKVEVNFQTF
jgi:outer membrane biosynthesis protein TonB